MEVIYVVVGILIGYVISSIIRRKHPVGFLRIDKSDPDGPYLFLELKKSVNEIVTQRTVLLEVKREDFIPHKYHFLLWNPIKTKGETNMGEENRSLLEEEIKAEIKRLGSLESGSQEHTTAVDSLTKLYKLKLEEDKNTYERLDKIENREIDQESKTAQMAESVKDRYFRFGMAAAELVLPLMFYGVWMRRGLKFEQDGTFTSQTFRGLFSRFRPTKK